MIFQLLVILTQLNARDVCPLNWQSEWDKYIPWGFHPDNGSLDDDLWLKRNVLPDDIWLALDKFSEENKSFCHTRWLGIQVLQAPEDLMILQRLIMEVRPEVFFEVGTYRGGLAFFVAHIFETLGMVNSRIVTMDLFFPYNNFYNINNTKYCPVCWDCGKAFETDLWRRYVTFVQGNANNLKEEIGPHYLQGKKVMITLDGLHSFRSTILELSSYARFVSVDSYAIVQDTKIDDVYELPGPKAAANKLILDEVGDWERDREVEIWHGHTQHTWLRRKRPHSELKPQIDLNFHPNFSGYAHFVPFLKKIICNIFNNQGTMYQAKSFEDCRQICGLTHFKINDLSVISPNAKCNFVYYSEEENECAIFETCSDPEETETGGLYKYIRYYNNGTAVESDVDSS